MGRVFEHARLIVDEVASGRPVALAVVVSVSGSAPRPVGTSMVVTQAGRVLGSLSGGCVESAVVQVAIEVVAGAPAATEVFGYSDAEALSVGLMCGGAVEVLVLRVDHNTPGDVLALWRAVAEARGAAGAAGAEIIPAAESTESSPADPTDRPDSATAGLGRGLTVRVTGERIGTLSTESHAPVGPARIDDHADSRLICPPPRSAPFLIYGGVDIAGPLATLARMAGYRVTVCDARPVFADPARFPDAHEVVRKHPAAHLREQPDDPTAVICVLTHEDRFDVPLLVEALRRSAAYVGAMGSRSTSARRTQLLAAEGITPAALARLHAPIGLDLGGCDANDTALAILAEVIANRNGRSGGRLRQGSGPLHTAVRQTRSRLNGVW